MSESDDSDKKLSKEDQRIWDEHMREHPNEEVNFETLLKQQEEGSSYQKEDKSAEPQEVVESVISSQQKPASKNSQIDRRTEEKLRKGKIPIEATIDLHGLTQRQAMPALENFITQSVKNKFRCVLVITGKGKPKLATDNIIEPEDGVLKKNVPDWLNSPMLKNYILKFLPARPQHGGSGALYVYLKRQR